MTSVIYPGTFDPITNGHLDIWKYLDFLIYWRMKLKPKKSLRLFVVCVQRRISNMNYNWLH